MTINGVHIIDEDPGFYACKHQLRKAFPAAVMIEVAEGMVTIAWGDGDEVQKHEYQVQ